MVLGGTFDHLHDGHYHLLKTAGYLSNTISIGLTSEKYLQDRPKKFQDKILPYKKRLENLMLYISQINTNFNYYIFPIDHPWKNFSINHPTLDSIITSEETLASLVVINKARAKKGLKNLSPVVISTVTSKKGNFLSSTKIREKVVKTGNF